jgi:hypothetical protein
MHTQVYLFFDGRCDEALEFYKKNLGIEVEMLMRFKDAPKQNEAMCTPGSENKVMHSCFKLGDWRVMASDGRGQADLPRLRTVAVSEGGGRGGSGVQRAERRRTGADAADEDVLLAKIWYGGGQVRRRMDGAGRVVAIGLQGSGNCRICCW